MSNYANQSYSESIQPGPSGPAFPEPDHSAGDDEDGGKKKAAKRRKVNHACLYCRRSHMTCDEGRPCQRCIKREIGHLCHDEQKPSKSTEKHSSVRQSSMDMSRQLSQNLFPSQSIPQTTNPSWSMGAPQGQFLYQPEGFGNEFSVLTDFLETLDDRQFFTPPPSTVTPSLMSAASYATPSSAHVENTFIPDTGASTSMPPPQNLPLERSKEESVPNVIPTPSKAEQFLLTAADQAPGSRDERLNRVIHSKYEAGLLKPYNYVKGYARLSRWMDRNVSQESKQQILQPLSVLRPKFRAIAQSLKDIDLVLIEEAFERLLLDYDRVFSAMAVPACLWRRTGEIYKGNREFSELVGVDGYMMRDGRLCIYELMAEESAVNYWEKYGQVAFDSNQKAVLTSCVLRYKPLITTPGAVAITATSRGNKRQPELPNEEGFINCCLSFTIRRDTWGIPSMIVGNFIKC